MLPVLLLFLIPVGGGIPGGVLLAQKNGLPWPLTSSLYLISDVILAFAFEPMMLLVIAIGKRIPPLARLAEAMRQSTLRTAERFGMGAGPFTLVMISFGIDPMTGRTAAHAAGHGFVGGWTIAITGDMLYFWVVMIATLRLNRFLGDPERTNWIILAAMFLLPWLAGKLKRAFGK